MKLYGSYTSPFVRHVRIILLETGFDCEFIETDQAGSSAKSPTQRVPFLEDGNVFLTDSLSIAKYLREKAGQDYCRSPQELDDFCLVNTVMDATVNLFFIKRDDVDITTVPYLQRQAARIQSTLAELNKFTPPLAAPYNDAQLRLACFIDWAKLRNQVDFSVFPNLEKFYAGALNYQPFAATQPPQS
ncbi:glutathione S-transferase [Cellvibrio sp. NN19]|uniref:glutathione S-transferase n=1 Tax=Cellvibrio chitinivorans TaxID=3102792 RepID=UPI002B40E782|nr:glutathione S-transferase [Cellvibrio sp. NN19]